MSCVELQNILDKFDTFTNKPAKFLTVQEDVKDDVKDLVKTLYDYTKSVEKIKNKSQSNALPKLIVNDFDEEQIWQEIELQNSEAWDHLVWEVANCISSENDLVFPVQEVHDSKTNEQNAKEEYAESESEDCTDGDKEEDEEEQEILQEKRIKTKSYASKPSVVDDGFFKLQEMERFLLKEEKKDGKPPADDSDEESIDFFDDIASEGSDNEEDGKDVMYSDFFNAQGDEHESELDFKPLIKRDLAVSFADVPSESEGENGDNYFDELEADPVIPANEKASEQVEGKNDDNKQGTYEKKSEFELRQLRLQQQIARLEGKTLSEAPWQLKGEVDASKRPQNSLLQEVVDFDLTTRPAPIITEETTLTLEEIIKQRVKDKAWDDVVKKEKPNENVLAFRKPEILDHSKSKLSLAQVYEVEYLKQKHASTDGNEKDVEEPESHKKIREAMNSLFAKLDALSHYHFTPRAAKPEVKIVGNTPAISMEEVAPIATSNAALLAPEEIKAKRKGELMSKDERTDTDRKRQRRMKLKQQKLRRKQKKVTEQRNTIKAVEATDKSLKTSKAFFQQLNDDTTSLIKSNKLNHKNVKNKGQ